LAVSGGRRHLRRAQARARRRAHPPRCARCAVQLRHRPQISAAAERAHARPLAADRLRRAVIESQRRLVMRRLRCAVLVIAALAGAARAQAQTYPSRPISMVVPYSAGGPTDTIARIMAERMRATLGQMVIVENVTGAAGTIGVGKVARGTRRLHDFY